MRSLTQEERDIAPEWATKFFIDVCTGGLCFESEESFVYYENGALGPVKDNVFGFEENSVPITGKQTNITTKTIEFKKGEILNTNYYSMVRHLISIPDKCSKMTSGGDVEFIDDVTITITVEFEE